MHFPSSGDVKSKLGWDQEDYRQEGQQARCSKRIIG